MVPPQLELVEASLERLHSRLGNVPVSEVLLTRLVLLLSHDLNLMLAHHIRPFGLGEGEFRVLTTLFSQPDGSANPSELCARATQSPANMSRICDALVERDLITRIASLADRRKTVLRISPKGEQLVQDLLPNLFTALRRLFEQFPAEEQRDMAAQLKRLVGCLDAAMHSPEHAQ
jgi:MarR family transcriptional repressor of emrRAB